MVDFSGWSMPVQYDSIVAEHHRTRSDVTMFDTCHMGRFFVSGPGSEDALSSLLTTDVKTLKDGQCRYGFLLRENGGIMDDLIIYRFTAERWMIVVNAGTLAKDREWIKARLPPGITFDDASPRLAKIDVQGPHAVEATARVLGIDASPLRYFHFSTFDLGGEAIMSRTGYTGEPGVELYIPAPVIDYVWRKFLADGVTPAGLGARDTLRLEAGLPLYGHELSENVTPVEAGLLRYASKSTPFIGREAVMRRADEGPRTRLIGFRIEGRQSARADHAVLVNNRHVGHVTSGSFSPTLHCVIGFAYIEPAAAVVGRHVQINTGRALLEAELVATPFYKTKERR